jgi:hypothetical protein
VNAVVGGWVAGYAMAVLSTIALTYLAMRPGAAAFAGHWLAVDVSRTLVAIPIFVGTTLAWTMAGLILGSAYRVGGFDEKAGAMGAPSWVFLLLIGAIAWLPLPVLVLLGRRYWWLWCSMSLAFVGLFGWLMPVLAER